MQNFQRHVVDKIAYGLNTIRVDIRVSLLSKNSFDGGHVLI